MRSGNDPRHDPPRGGPRSPTAAAPVTRPLTTSVTGSATRSVTSGIAIVLAALVVLEQIAYPLAGSTQRTALTLTTVLAFALASALHATVSGGRRTLVRLLAAAAGLGFLAEAVGVATGFPFGAYSYTHTLGPQLLGVPVVVPAAWLMMTWPALVAARRVATRWRWPTWTPVPMAALTLSAWDLALDPQMVAAGRWHWEHPSPALPGVTGIPLTNTLGWLLTSLVICGLLHATAPSLPDPGRGDLVPAVLLGWTWLGSAIGNAAFFGRPAVAAWVFVGMGLLTSPYLALVWRSLRSGGVLPDVSGPAARADETTPARTA